MNVLLTTIAIVLLLPFSASGNEPSYSHLCKNQEHSGYVPGLIPTACKASSFGDSYRAKHVYEEFLIDASQVKDNDREADQVYQYMSNVAHLVDQLARQYYKDKNPKRKISDAEMQAWVDSIFAKMFQESFFSHYRLSKHDGKTLKLLVGDFDLRTKRYRSVGLSQINSEAHDVKRTGKYFDLANNILKGLEIYYSPWSIAVSSKSGCLATVKSNDYSKRAQAAYARYNGGKICRWYSAEAKMKKWEKDFGCNYKKRSKVCGYKLWFNSPTHLADWEAKNCKLSEMAGNKKCRSSFKNLPVTNFWRNDLNYKRQLSKKPWQKYISKTPVVLPQDLKCLTDGYGFCTMSEATKASYLRSSLVRLPLDDKDKGGLNTCVFDDQGNAHCVYDEGAVACLSSFQNIQNYDDLIYLEKKDIDVSQLNINVYKDTVQLCESAITGLVPVGNYIKVLKSVAVRPGPYKSSGYVASTKANKTVLQVVDHFVSPNPKGDRYYIVIVKTRYGYKQGYIYAGNNKTWNKWTEVVVPDTSVVGFIPKKGDYIKVEVSELPIYEKYKTTVREIKVKLPENLPKESVSWFSRFFDDDLVEDPQETSVYQKEDTPIAVDEGIFKQPIVELVKKDSVLYIDEVYVVGPSGDIFGEVATVGNRNGFVYLGQLRPTFTLSENISVVKDRNKE